MIKNALPVLAIFFILTASSAHASQVDISVQPSEQSGHIYSTVRYKMTITNNQNHEDIFQAVYSGDHVDWFVPTRIAKAIPAHSSDESYIEMYPTGNDTGNFDFFVTAESVLRPGISSKAGFTLSIPYDLLVKGFAAEPSGKTATFMLDLEAPEEKTVSGIFILMDGSGRPVGSIEFQETFKGQNRITRILTLPENLVAGTYTSQFKIDGRQMHGNSSFSIKPARSIVQSSEEKDGIMSKTVIISVTNNGNLVEKDYSFEQAFPIDSMTGLLTRPGDRCYEKDGSVVCAYNIREIRPGATAYVSYSVSSWPAFSGYLLISVILSGLVLFSFVRATTPSILKRHSRKGDGKHNILIHVKNPFLHNLREVIVKDHVSPLAHVLHDEIDSVKPVMRKTEEGTDLIWRLGEMKPREERVLQYKVKSLVGGSLKMPSAHLKFTTSKGKERKVRISSNSIILR